MNSPLQQIDELSEVIRQLHKIDSKLQAGQFIAAWRDNRKLIADLEKNKSDFIRQEISSKHEADKIDQRDADLIKASGQI